MATNERGGRPDVDRGPEQVASRLVPVGMGVVTWLLVLLAGGVVLSMGSVSFASLGLLPVLVVLFLPVYRFRPWREGVTGRVLGFPRSRRRVVAVTLGLFVLVRLPVVPDLLGPLSFVLSLPDQVVPRLFFGVSVFYDTRVGEPVGRLLFEFGLLYVQLVWLYSIGRFVVLVAPGGSE